MEQGDGKEEKKEGEYGPEPESGPPSGRTVLRGWLIVCGISVAFVLYGFFAFFAIGDKGPPDWDYGSLPDVPGQSVYSTYPYSEGNAQPEPQHVDGKPAGVQAAVLAGQAPPTRKSQPEQEPAQR